MLLKENVESRSFLLNFVEIFENIATFLQMTMLTTMLQTLMTMMKTMMLRVLQSIKNHSYYRAHKNLPQKPKTHLKIITVPS